MKDERDLDEILFTTILSSLFIMIAMAAFSLSYVVGGWIGPVLLATVVVGGYFSGKILSKFE
jgi:hypothetical protein